MKVLHITNNYPTKRYPIFGIFVKEQIDSLTNLGITNKVFFINSREKGIKEYIFSYFRLLVHLIRNKYDLIHCHHSFSAAIFAVTLYPIFSKCVVSFQNDPSREWKGKLFPICNLLFDRMILKNNSMKYSKYRKCIYFPKGVDINLFRPLLKEECLKVTNLDSFKKYILFLDSYNRRIQKRIDRFNQVIQILREEYGRTDIEPLVLTNTERKYIPYFMNISEVHLLTSDFEGSPNSVKECLACNTKVVTTPVGNVDDLIGDIPGCYISESFDPKELAVLVVKSLEYENFQGRSNLISKKLDINNTAIKLKNIYDLIING